MQSIKNGIDSRLHATNKNTFKCIKMPDGSIYYGQVIEILPNELKPKDGSVPAGFRKYLAMLRANSSAATSDGLSSNLGSRQDLHDKVDDPFVVDDRTQISEEMQHHV